MLRPMHILPLTLVLTACLTKVDSDDDGDDGDGSDGGSIFDGGSSDGGSSDGGANDGGANDGGVIARLRTHDGYADGDTVTVVGTVTSPDAGSGFFIQDASGPWTGIWVYDHYDYDATQGERVEVTGVLADYNGLAEIDASKGTITSLGAGDDIVPVVVDVTDLSDDGTAEPYESVLIEVHNVTVTDENPDGPDNDYGEFVIDAAVRVDDLFYDAAGVLGETFTRITGPLYYSYGNFKITPRDESDVAR